MPEDLVPAPVPGIDWSAVWNAAVTAATAPEIIKGLRIPEAALAPPHVVEAFRRVVEAGNGAGLLQLKRLVARRSMESRRSDGSSNVLALRARNELDYDRQLPAQETEPDLGTARPRLRELLIRMAAAQSEIRGRTVSPAELLAEEAGLIRAASDVPRDVDESEDDTDRAKKGKKGRP
jgi:hypothetical protein